MNGFEKNVYLLFDLNCISLPVLIHFIFSITGSKMFSFVFSLESLDLISLFWIISSVLIVGAHIIMHLDISSGHAAFQTITDLVKPFYFFGKLKQTHLKKNSSCQRSVLSRLVDILSSIPKR